MRLAIYISFEIIFKQPNNIWFNLLLVIAWF